MSVHGRAQTPSKHFPRDSRGRFTEAAVPRLSSDEIHALARDLVTNVAWMPMNENEMRLAFPILAFAAPGMSDAYMASAGAVWEYLSKASPVGINGLPLFLSCHLVHKEDVPLLRAAMARMYEALNG